jgi:hypothetical protein
MRSSRLPIVANGTFMLAERRASGDIDRKYLDDLASLGFKPIMPRAISTSPTEFNTGEAILFAV